MNELTVGIALILVQVIVSIFSNKNEEIKKNTEAIVKLTTQMEHVYKAIEDMPKVKQDINAAHEKIRGLNREQ